MNDCVGSLKREELDNYVVRQLPWSEKAQNPGLGETKPNSTTQVNTV